MARIASNTEGVSLVDLYARYPTFEIDVEVEQQQLLAHDVIVFQFPLYWYSTPALLKEWQDLVLEHGFAYGTGGIVLQGKVLMAALSSGGDKGSYQHDGANKHTIKETLTPLKQTANISGMHYLPPFCLFNARSAKKENRLEQHLDDWEQLLTLLRDHDLDFEQLDALPTCNLALNTMEEKSQDIDAKKTGFDALTSLGELE